MVMIVIDFWKQEDKGDNAEPLVALSLLLPTLCPGHQHQYERDLAVLFEWVELNLTVLRQ